MDEKCIARYNEKLLEHTEHKPSRRRIVNIPCPGRSCPSVPCDWHCLRCGDFIYYGNTDMYIYCDCAGCLYSSYDFQCTNAQHGPAFQRYDQELLLKLLTALEPSPELNILILGEIGSGKDHLYQRIHQLPKIRNTSRWNE
jgi:hypothetical protein